jgi:4-amino-4-deoxy-L-arabinose transferase-like glycosyltransferase
MKKRSRRAAPSADPAVRSVNEKGAAPAYWTGFLAFLDRYAIWLAVGLVVLATGRIVSTYSTFSHTFDEPAHIACGMEWLEKHTYTYEPQHPPLTRVMTALLPRMFGSHGAGQASMWDEGLAILFAHGPEDSTLALARIGTLPFFWITCWIVYSCTRWISGSAAAAVIAVFLATMTPSVLAHAGLATTDMGLTAMLLLAIYTGWRWMEEPVLWRAAVFGASAGLAVLAKFSTLAFLPSVALAALIIWLCFERPAIGTLIKLALARGVQLLLAAMVASLVIWAGYRFSFGKTPGVSFPVPAPELFSGIADVRKHNANGHLTYLLGAANTVGWPYFYVVALAVKTPLAVLALGLPGLALLFSRKRFGTRGWMVPSVVLGILIFASFFSQIKIGTRHVLPVFVMLAIAGGCASIWIPRAVSQRATQPGKQQGLAQAAVALLLLSVAISSASAHPDYLAYFNMIVRGKPEAYLVDSDLDWGQDTKRLAQRLKEVGAREVYFNQFAAGNLEKEYGFPPIRPLDVNGPQLGWNAISLTPMKLGLYGDTRYIYDRGTEFWPERLYLPERVGSSYILFNREK